MDTIFPEYSVCRPGSALYFKCYICAVSPHGTEGTESNYTVQKRLLNIRATSSCYEAADHAQQRCRLLKGRIFTWASGLQVQSPSCCRCCIEYRGMLCANLAYAAVVLLMLLLWVPRGRWSQYNSQPHSLPLRIPPMNCGATSLHLSQRAKRVLAQELTVLIDGALN